MTEICGVWKWVRVWLDSLKCAMILACVNLLEWSDFLEQIHYFTCMCMLPRLCPFHTNRDNVKCVRETFKSSKLVHTKRYIDKRSTTTSMKLRKSFPFSAINFMETIRIFSLFKDTNHRLRKFCFFLHFGCLFLL